MSNESENQNRPQDSSDEQQFTLQDIVLSNSWAVQAILNYLEECDPHARDRIWHHYELLKDQQNDARRARNGNDHAPSDLEDDDE